MKKSLWKVLLVILWYLGLISCKTNDPIKDSNVFGKLSYHETLEYQEDNGQLAFFECKLNFHQKTFVDFHDKKDTSALGYFYKISEENSKLIKEGYTKVYVKNSEWYIRFPLPVDSITNRTSMYSQVIFSFDSDKHSLKLVGLPIVIKAEYLKAKNLDNAVAKATVLFSQLAKQL